MPRKKSKRFVKKAPREPEPLFAEDENRPLVVHLLRKILENPEEDINITAEHVNSILDKEFNIDVTKLHELEKDIYTGAVNKYLTGWTMWNSFVDWSQELMLKKQKLDSTLKRPLERYYRDIKRYLRGHLDAAKPRAKDAVQKVTAKVTNETSNINLLIYCTQKQLDDLIINCPSLQPGNNIFHVADIDPNATSVVKTLSMESILNWWGVHVTINIKSLTLVWYTQHQQKHVLVNQENGPAILNEPLIENVLIKENRRTKMPVLKTKVYEFLDAISQKYEGDDMMNLLVKALFAIIKCDLDGVEGDKAIVPSLYRRYTNRYPYYRKLNKEKNAALSPSQCELYMVETVAPTHEFYIEAIGNILPLIPARNAWLTVECTVCETKFRGANMPQLLKEHFEVNHSDEKDWICTNCHETFPMIELTRNTWHHDC